MNEESGDKKKSAHKRQEQRDARRSKTNSNRSQEEEDNERRRKDKQARNRGNRCTDPSEPGCGNDDFPRNREAKRKYRCETRGESCEHGRTNSDKEPNRRRANEDMDCVDWCHENNYDDSDADKCVNKNCASNGSWIFNGAATYGEYLDLLLEEANAKPRKTALAQE